MSKNSFGTVLSELRKEKGLRREELANILGCSSAAVGNYENGNRNPDFDTLIRIADYFDVTTDYLLGRTISRSTDPEIQAISDYTGLSDQAIKVVHLLNELKQHQIQNNISRKVYEIDFIDWYLRKMEHAYHMLSNIVCVVNADTDKDVKSGDDVIEYLCKNAPDGLVDYIFSKGIIIVGYQLRKYLITLCIDDFENLIRCFAAEYDPINEFEKEVFSDEFLIPGGSVDLETSVKNRIESWEKENNNPETSDNNKKDGEDSGNN